jgi:putative restriction endonuclease
MAKPIFGELPGVPIGTRFANRDELSKAGVHRPSMAGIAGSRAGGGAESIVLNGGYEDDLDEGSWIVYTGQGGNDPESGRQIADQELTRGNLALTVNELEGIPVRVIRGYKNVSKLSPHAGFRYDGLYYVDKHWHQKGRAGFRIYRFLLRQASVEISPETIAPVLGFRVADRQLVEIQRIVMNTEVAREVKRINEYKCQVCSVRLETVSGPYAEGAHIRPLGHPHNGPDIAPNILCMCANHHVLFDRGAFSVADDRKLIGIDGNLISVRGHTVGDEFLAYHRDHYLALVDGGSR